MEGDSRLSRLGLGAGLGLVALAAAVAALVVTPVAGVEGGHAARERLGVGARLRGSGFVGDDAGSESEKGEEGDTHGRQAVATVGKLGRRRSSSRGRGGG